MAKKLFFFLLIMVFLGGIGVYHYSSQAYKLFFLKDQEDDYRVRPDNWHEFVSAIGKFKVMLPADPQHATQSLPVPNANYHLQYDMYAVDDENGDTFMISLVTYPDDVNMSNPQSILENLMNEMLKANPKNQLQSMQFTQFDGYDTLDFKLGSPDIEVTSRAFVVDQTLFLLTMIGKKDRFHQRRFDYFVHSFALLHNLSKGKKTPSSG